MGGGMGRRLYCGFLKMGKAHRLKPAHLDNFRGLWVWYPPLRCLGQERGALCCVGALHGRWSVVWTPDVLVFLRKMP